MVNRLKNKTSTCSKEREAPVLRGTQRWSRHARCLAKTSKRVKALLWLSERPLSKNEDQDILCPGVPSHPKCKMARKSPNRASPEAPRAIRRGLWSGFSPEIETFFACLAALATCQWLVERLLA